MRGSEVCVFGPQVASDRPVLHDDDVIVRFEHLAPTRTDRGIMGLHLYSEALEKPRSQFPIRTIG